MKNQGLLRGFIALPVLLCFISAAAAQKLRPKPAAAPQKPIIFAVLNNGTTLEPIAFVGTKLTAPVNGSDEQSKIIAFDKLYYRKGSTYRLIFGGANSGTVSIKDFDPNAECSRNMANVTTTGTKTPLKGVVMALATNAPSRSTAAGFRRKPTAAEKAEMDALAKAEFLKQKLIPKVLHYQNLTAVDADNDGKAEFVASYWIEIDKLTRGLLFFIARKGSNGKYSLGHHEYRVMGEASLMSGANITAVDEGVYNELLLDVFDYNGDGTAEIFTYEQGLEGAGFTVYELNGRTWKRTYEFNNYHCGF